jgi:hypothetical protein
MENMAWMSTLLFEWNDGMHIVPVELCLHGQEALLDVLCAKIL